MCKDSLGGFGSTALEMKLDKLDGLLWIFFRLPVATWCVSPKKPPGSLEAFGVRGVLGVGGAAPSCHSQQLPKLP